MRRTLFTLAFGLALFAAPAVASAAQSYPYCPLGVTPFYVFGFAALHDALGDTMGDPLECEHTEVATGDAHQQTEKGLSFYRKSTNTPTFTNGWEHWAITAAGLVYWTGDSIDPPSDIAEYPYSAAAVWDWYAHFEALPALCGAASWFDLFPETNPQDAGCVADAMRTLGASSEAVRFFETTGQFLYSFEEIGRVDVGHSSTPWVNMGRGEAVFLNGTPSTILVPSAFAAISEHWEREPGYAELLRRYPSAFPWLEYGALVEAATLADGGQRLVFTFPMRECRACPEVAVVPVAFRFDARGVLQGADILPPRPPSST